MIGNADILRERAVKYCDSLLHIAYRWAGDDPMAGFDCSGGAQEILASVGLDPRGDQTAHQLMEHYIQYKVAVRGLRIPKGALVFFGTASRITHVGFSVGYGQMFEFGGGGSRTKTEADAIAQNAYGRIRPITRRSDLVMVCDPFLSLK